jgi:hypothetical protein
VRVKRGNDAAVRAATMLAVVLGATVARAAPWETTRRTVIDPLNTTLHRHLPQHVTARELDALVALYTTDTGTGIVWGDGPMPTPADDALERVRWGGSGTEPIRERWARLLALFPTIDKAELRIDRVAWDLGTPATGWPATARLLVRGVHADGRRAQLEEHLAWRIASRDGQWRIAAEEVTVRTMVARRTAQFAVATDAAGLRNVHANDGSPPYRLFGGGPGNPVGASGGSAVADVDGDGCEDVFLSGSDAALFRNRCDGTFADVTASAGLPRPWPAVATGALFVDADNDGWPDLFVTAVQGGDRLFHNAGGRFTDVTAASGITPGRWASMAVAADYDRDGFLDLYVVRMGDHAASAPAPNFSATNGVPNTLWRSRGDGTFEDATARAGVGSTGWDLAAAWGDYDGDGWPDLYVANEFGDNALYHNRGDGTFDERAAAAGVRDGGAGMGVAWGDYDGDGDLDLFVSNMHANSAWALFHPDFPVPIPMRYRLLGLLFPGEVRRRAAEYIDRLSRGSTLFRNDGDGRFSDASDAAGVRDGQWGWAAQFLDYDADGRLDLYAVNGFISGPLLDDV